MPASTSRARAVGHVGVDFGRMVYMNHHNGAKPAPPEPGHQIVGHALGDHHRQPSVDSQPAKMGNFGQSSRQSGQLGVRQHQRIAAA